MIRTAKGFLLAGASVVAILAAAADAQAETITAIGSGTYTIPVTGEYLIELFGAQGGTGGDAGGVGGLGAEVVAQGFFTAGTELVLFVGGQGGSGAPGGGGGGGPTSLIDGSIGADAGGGGGGANGGGAGGPGQSSAIGQHGYGLGGGYGGGEGTQSLGSGGVGGGPKYAGEGARACSTSAFQATPRLVL